MAGYIRNRNDVKKTEATALNLQINKDVLDGFKEYCTELRYPMNVLLEVFMRQYNNGKLDITYEEVVKWREDDSETITLNTTLNKDIYMKFKSKCEHNGKAQCGKKYAMRHVVTAFMVKILNEEYALELVELKQDN